MVFISLARASALAHAPSAPLLSLTCQHALRRFTTSSAFHKANNNLPPRPSVPVEETTKKSLKGSGPGGQKINKTNSAIQLRHKRTGIVVKCQATRSRSQNEKIARRILAEKVELLEKGAHSRAALKTEQQSRKKRSAEKKRRRKYRKLTEDKEGAAAATLEDDEIDGEEFDDDEDRREVLVEESTRILEVDKVVVQDIHGEFEELRERDSRRKGK